MFHVSYCDSFLFPYFQSCPHESVFISLYNLNLQVSNGSHSSQSKSSYNGLEISPPSALLPISLS